jgi:hypothetical protein
MSPFSGEKEKDIVAFLVVDDFAGKGSSGPLRKEVKSKTKRY